MLQLRGWAGSQGSPSRPAFLSRSNFSPLGHAPVPELGADWSIREASATMAPRPQRGPGDLEDCAVLLITRSDLRDADPVCPNSTYSNSQRWAVVSLDTPEALPH